MNENTEPTGLVIYDLSQAALSLFPVLTPLRNAISRVKADTGSKTTWEAVTGISMNPKSVSVSKTDFTAPYESIGLEDNPPADCDRANAAHHLLLATMVAEEQYIIDSMISQISAGHGSYCVHLDDDAELTPDGEGGIAEVSTALKSFWDNYRLAPDLMLMNARELISLSRSRQKTAEANASIPETYFNPFPQSGGAMVEIKLHPSLPAGTILFLSRCLPYPLEGVTNLLQMKVRRDYYQIDYPEKDSQRKMGVYVDEVLEMYFPPAFGMIMI